MIAVPLMFPIFGLLSGCGGLDRPPGWSALTHGKDTSPNYERLFSSDVVHELRLVFRPDDFQTMQDDLAELVTESEDGRQPFPPIPPRTGTSSSSPPGLRPPPPESAVRACEGLAAGAPCTFEAGGAPRNGECVLAPDGTLVCDPGTAAPDDQGQGRGGGALNKLSRDPIYVPAAVEHEGRTWRSVGIRYKGNSSLTASFVQGIRKLPFRISFDQFEAEDRAIRDQRFYGFRELTFSSNWGDDSLLRECFTKEVFRDRGVPAPRCAFYRIFADVGNGPEYWGLYSAVEDPDDGAMLDSQFGGRGGNLYKPEGPGADWTHFEEAGFEKKTHADEADFTDIQLAIEALHSDEPDPAAYRAALEARFDAPMFVTWLAINTVIYNWDTYGRGAHNYYLYGDPGRNGQLRWISWDHNLAMMVGQPGARTSSRPTTTPASDSATAVREVFHTNVGDEWPLIRRLLEDPVYSALYREEVEASLHGLFAESSALDRLGTMHALIEPYVVGEEGERAPYTTLRSEKDFTDSISGAGGLADHIAERHALVKRALGER